MRRAAAGLVVMLLGVDGVVHHSGAQPTTTAPASHRGILEQSTRIDGAAPPLEGRWLAIVSVGVGGARRSTASRWEVTRTPAGLVLDERHVALPEALRRVVEVPDWTPAAADVQAIAAAWDGFETAERGIARIDHDLFGPGAPTEEAQREPMAADALWLVRQTYAFAPAPARPLKELRLLAAKHEDATGYRGESLTVVLAAAPLPIPIRIPGTFRLVRVPPSAPSFWTRVADVLRGCN